MSAPAINRLNMLSQHFRRVEEKDVGGQFPELPVREREAYFANVLRSRAVQQRSGLGPTPATGVKK
ncbi:unnamed protein product [Kuraishia capsulata CBS 1993]|uniref:Uncharacterized protein n=1 Tax=Kuraishia capsulata CBS 1993 TaxID=1382522 RepID=W6MSW3_9ASCO|nr:uncharacterized protein KUCA_T00000827001 [Kuraishia capsulata CBS 1993]CDK24860.1 unnamed protein product [Kuraishia capsulata CBS 1993]